MVIVGFYLFYLYAVWGHGFSRFATTGLVGFCRDLSLDTDKRGIHNQTMYNLDKYIPREYLALKINYCNRELARLPVLKKASIIVKGKLQECIFQDNHRYFSHSQKGRELQSVIELRDRLERELDIYQAIWDSNFKGEPPREFAPHKVKRWLTEADNSRVVMDKAYFDSLKSDSNTKYAKYSTNFFDGIYYKSAAEKQIAIWYTEMGIPFKYEPEIWLAGLAIPVNPDFILYIRELDNCKFHEHFGIKSSADYLRNTRIKYSNFTGAGLLPGTDIIFTYDNDELPFDIRGLESNLNNAVYNTMICKL